MTAINLSPINLFNKAFHRHEKKPPANAAADTLPLDAQRPASARAPGGQQPVDFRVPLDRPSEGRSRQLGTRVFERHHPVPYRNDNEPRSLRETSGAHPAAQAVADPALPGARVRRDTAFAESGEDVTGRDAHATDVPAVQPPGIKPMLGGDKLAEPAIIAEAKAAYDSRAASPADWVAAAKLAKCEPAVLGALYKAQAAARPAFKAGYPAMQFRRDVFAMLSQHRYDKSQHEVSGDPYVPNGKVRQDGEFFTRADWQGSPREQYERLARAAALDESAALQACDWGPYRLSGTEYGACGYDKVQDFVRDMFKSEAAQLSVFAKYCASRVDAAALADRNWIEIARGMKPPKSSDRAIAGYAKRLEALYAKPTGHSTRLA